MAKLLLLSTTCYALVPPLQPTHTKLRAATLEEVERIPTPAFGKTFGDDVSKLKAAIFHYGATLDRGQGFNPTTGEQYKDRMDRAVAAVEALCEKGGAPDVSPEKLRGRWELVFSSVPHGIFRSSPFFEAIYDSYANVGKPDKAELFFKLHELQTMSWGASKIGRVAQTIDPDNNMLYSEFDTQIFSLTAIPIIGFWKLLPTFGGCVVTASKMNINENALNLEVEYTTAKPVEGLSGLGEWIWDVKVPVGAVWKLLPWNRGLPPTCAVEQVYLDDDVRIAKDTSGQYFVYARPV